MGDCWCHRLPIGDNYDWNSECPEHGLTSEWYNSAEESAARHARRIASLELQLKAARARGASAEKLASLEAYLQSVRSTSR